MYLLVLIFSRYHDNSHLNWTVKTSYLCTEYFDEISAFPAPFSILHIVYLAINKCTKSSKSAKTDVTPEKNYCDHDEVKRRKDYAELMKTLIQRINDEKTN